MKITIPWISLHAFWYIIKEASLLRFLSRDGRPHGFNECTYLERTRGNPSAINTTCLIVVIYK